jgi:hypothetical protein
MGITSFCFMNEIQMKGVLSCGRVRFPFLDSEMMS